MSCDVRAAADLVGLVALDGLSDDDYDALVTEVAALRAAVDGLWLRVVADAEERALHRRHQVRDTGTWLAAVAGERVGAVRRDVELAGVLASAAGRRVGRDRARAVEGQDRRAGPGSAAPGRGRAVALPTRPSARRSSRSPGRCAGPGSTTPCPNRPSRRRAGCSATTTT